MTPIDILAYTRAVPFRPFQVTLNSGKFYEIRHPEMIAVSESSLIYVHRTHPDQPGKWETVSLSLIQNIEHTDSPASTH